ncbi:PqqD family protein [Novosphingobium aquae]|uniref:PqqD family protein n=1 Tax=Novosphingobium aquae TaxID=3133435 RepID=A0ABU8SDW4_9SPHN
MNLSDPAQRFVRAQDSLSCDIDGEIAVLNPDSKQYFGLTEVAALVWEELESPKSFDAIVSEVMRVYDVKEAECRRSLSNFILEMCKLGLVIPDGSEVR